MNVYYKGDVVALTSELGIPIPSTNSKNLLDFDSSKWESGSYLNFTSIGITSDSRGMIYDDNIAIYGNRKVIVNNPTSDAGWFSYNTFDSDGNGIKYGRIQVPANSKTELPLTSYLAGKKASYIRVSWLEFVTYTAEQITLEVI